MCNLFTLCCHSKVQMIASCRWRFFGNGKMMLVFPGANVFVEAAVDNRAGEWWEWKQWIKLNRLGNWNFWSYLNIQNPHLWMHSCPQISWRKTGKPAHTYKKTQLNINNINNKKTLQIIKSSSVPWPNGLSWEHEQSFSRYSLPVFLCGRPS